MAPEATEHDDPAVKEAWEIIEDLRSATREYLSALDAAIEAQKGNGHDPA